MEHVRQANLSVTPKLHTLEEHVPSFLNLYRRGLAYIGEQGGECFHNRQVPVKYSTHILSIYKTLTFHNYNTFCQHGI